MNRLEMNLVNKSIFILGGLMTCLSARAQISPAEHAAHHRPTAAATAPLTPSLTEGEIRRIDPLQKKVTLRHGQIVNLDMPPMTMVFQVADEELLSGRQVGDKVRFAAEQIAGALVVTRIEEGSE
jgi:Cu(I)/Ag(I) efflux system periplasmic protein CusF